MAVDIKSIEGSEPVEPDWGERFRSWYLFKKPLRTENLPLGYGDLTYRFTICDYLYRFIIPAALEFDGGIISYSEAERLLGVFRYPRDANGRYATPVTWNRSQWQEILELNEEELKSLIGNREVLTFEAFRIPSYGFEYLSVSDAQFKEIQELTGLVYTRSLRDRYNKELQCRIEQVQAKIRGSPNYLFILLSVLNLRGPEPRELSQMTNKIIHL